MKNRIMWLLMLCVLVLLAGCASEPISFQEAVDAQTEAPTNTPTLTPTPSVEPINLTEAETFAAGNDISVAFAESLESVLAETNLSDKSHPGVFNYDLSDVYNFEQMDDWAEGERYKMWMDMEHVWYAYCKGDTVVGVRDGNGNIYYQAE